MIGPRHHYASSAIVHAPDTIAELEGRAARRVLEEERTLTRYAVALLHADCSGARFFWRTGRGEWVRVRMERTQTGNGEECVVALRNEEPPFGLTVRELDVLTLLAGGLHNREIGARLRTSTRTVSTHVEHILMKLGARTRAGAAAMAVERGLLRLPVPDGGLGMEGLAIGELEVLVRTLDHEPTKPASLSLARHRPYLIGSAVPLSGPARADGMEMRNGATLAIDEINSRGGVAGRPIEHVLVDTDVFTEEGVQTAFEQLVEAEVDAITIGYALAGADLILELAADYSAPYLHATTSEAQLGRVRSDPVRFRRIFQVCPSEVHYGRGFVRFLDDLVTSGRWSPEGRRLMIVETPVHSGQMATTPTRQAAAASGWTIDAVECVPELGADWEPLVRRVRQIDPDAVLIADFVPAELAAFQLTFAAEPTRALVYALYTPSVPEFLELAGPAAEGLVWSTMTGTYSDLLGRRFAGHYTRAFGRPPGRSHAGIAYDEVHLLANAWASAGNPRDFDAVAAHLRRGAFRGVNGAYYFDDSQGALAYPDMTPDPSLGQAHLVFQIQDGQHRVLSPAPYVEASFRWPSWCVPAPA